jgi:hypothetical protein
MINIILLVYFSTIRHVWQVTQYSSATSVPDGADCPRWIPRFKGYSPPENPDQRQASGLAPAGVPTLHPAQPRKLSGLESRQSGPLWTEGRVATMRPQRGASWRLDGRPAARFSSRRNVFFSAIMLDGNSPVRFHKPMTAAALEKSPVHEAVHAPRPAHCYAWRHTL